MLHLRQKKIAREIENKTEMRDKEQVQLPDFSKPVTRIVFQINQLYQCGSKLQTQSLALSSSNVNIILRKVVSNVFDQFKSMKITLRLYMTYEKMVIFFDGRREARISDVHLPNKQVHTRREDQRK